MDKPIVRKFLPNDLTYLDTTKGLNQSARGSLDVPGLTFTAEVNGIPVLSGGIVFLWPGSGEAWVAFGSYAKVHPMWSARLVKQKLKYLFTDFEFNRVQMHVTPGDEQSERFALFMGFIFEGTNHRYTPFGHDMKLYAMWRK